MSRIYSRIYSEFARLVQRLKQVRISRETVQPPPDFQVKTLIRTKRLMRQQTSVLAVAIFFTLAPFVFTFQDDRINFLLIRDPPVVGGIWLAVASAKSAAMPEARRMLRGRLKEDASSEELRMDPSGTP